MSEWKREERAGGRRSKIANNRCLVTCVRATQGPVCLAITPVCAGPAESVQKEREKEGRRTEEDCSTGKTTEREREEGTSPFISSQETNITYTKPTRFGFAIVFSCFFV